VYFILQAAHGGDMSMITTNLLLKRVPRTVETTYEDLEKGEIQDLLKRVPWVVETIYEDLEKGEFQFGAIRKTVFYNEAVLEKFLHLLKFFSLQLVEDEDLYWLYIIRKEKK
jgi:hypothetical protein